SGWTSVGSLSSKSVTVGGNVTITGQAGFLAFGDFANDGEEVVNAHVAGDVTMDLGSGVGNTALFGNGTSASSTSAKNVIIMSSGAQAAVPVGPWVVKGALAVAPAAGRSSRPTTGHLTAIARRAHPRPGCRSPAASRPATKSGAWRPPPAAAAIPRLPC